MQSLLKKTMVIVLLLATVSMVAAKFYNMEGGRQRAGIYENINEIFSFNPILENGLNKINSISRPLALLDKYGKFVKLSEGQAGNYKKNTGLDKATEEGRLSVNKSEIRIVDKRRQNIQVLPGQRFCVERTVSGPTGTNLSFATVFSEGPVLKKIEVKGGGGSNSISKIIGRKGNQIQEGMKEIKRKLPSELKELEKISISPKFTLQSNRTVEMCFRAPKWAEDNPTSGRISYLVYSGNKVYDYEASDWWNSNWNYCRDITVSDGIDGYQYKLHITDTTHMDQNSIRIVNASCNDGGSVVDHWTESWAMDDATVWFEGSGTGTNYAIYYNNSEASDTSDGGATFNFFDGYTSDTTGEFTEHNYGSHSSHWMYDRPSWNKKSKRIIYKIEIKDYSANGEYGRRICTGGGPSYNAEGSNAEDLSFCTEFLADTDGIYDDTVQQLSADDYTSKKEGYESHFYLVEHNIVLSGSQRYIDSYLKDLTTGSTVFDETLTDGTNYNFDITHQNIFGAAGWGESHTFSWDSGKEALYVRAKRIDHNGGDVEIYQHWYVEGKAASSDPTTSLGNEISGNDPPDEPDNLSPGDNDIIASESVTLSVNVSDPDGDSMDVCFYNASDGSEIGCDTGVPSGETASVNWDVSNGTHDWYAVATD